MLNRQQRSFLSKGLQTNIEASTLFLPKCLQGLYYLSPCVCRISAACHSSVEGLGHFAISSWMAINSLLLTVIVLIDRAFELAPVIYGDMPLRSKSSLISIKYRLATGTNFSHSHYNLFSLAPTGEGRIATETQYLSDNSD